MIDVEINEISNKILNHTKNKKIHSYVNTEDFRNILLKFPTKICEQCGFEYRFGHWCDAKKKQVWITKWFSILHASYRAYMQQWRKEKKLIKKQERQDKKLLVKANSEAKHKKKSPARYIFWVLFVILLIIGVVVALDNLNFIIELFD